MALAADIQKLEPGALVDLFILDLNPINVGTILYFYEGTDAAYGDIKFQGQLYSPWPIKLEGVERRGSGSEARPKVTVSNFQMFISSYVTIHEDLVGAKITRRRTLGTYTGDDIVDASTYLEEAWFIEQKTAENLLLVEFELVSGLDYQDKQLPGRMAIANACNWQYKNASGGSGCSWPGTNSSLWYDATGTQVFNQNEDVCGKKLSDCEKRFGATGTKELDFGGFPALGRF